MLVGMMGPLDILHSHPLSGSFLTMDLCSLSAFTSQNSIIHSGSFDH